MTDKEIIIDGKIIGCPCYIDRPLHRYHKGCLVQSQAFKEQQTEEKPILRCDEIKNCPIKENFKQLQCKTAECEELKERLVRTEEDLKYQCVDCMNVKSGRYREALEEIEKVINNILNSCLGRNTVSCRPAHNVCGDLINILDIISRAKGEK